MRKRDIGIVLLCSIGLLVTLQGEGSLTLQPRFYIPIENGAARLSPLPKPIVTDLNGDGRNEIIALVDRQRIDIFSPSKLHRVHDFVQFPPVRSITTGRAVIGIGTGYKEPYQHKPRKQIIVVVTDDYAVAAYDEAGTQLWIQLLPGTTHVIFVPDFASVLVLPHAVHKDDSGLVVIGVDTKQQLEDLGAEDGQTPHENTNVHFSYFCLNAQDGAVRWKHDASSFLEDQAGKVYPKQNYKITATHVERHSGEQDWRIYRRSMLGALPHTYTHLHDTSMTAHHFSKKLSQKRHKANEKKDKAKVQGQERGKPNADTFGQLGERMSGLKGAVQEKLSGASNHEQHPGPNVVVVHREEGIEVLHLYTGRTLCQLGPLKPGVVYDDVNGDSMIEAVWPHIANTHQHHAPGKTDNVKCHGTVETGLPGMHHDVIWNGTICVRNGVLKQFAVLKDLLKAGEHQPTGTARSLRLAEWGDRDHTAETTVAARPAVLHRRVPEFQGLRKLRTYVLFFVNTGLVTAVDPSSKRIVWQVETDATFEPAEESAEEEELFGDIAGLSLRGTTPHHKDQRSVRHFPHMVPFAVPAVHVSVEQRKVKAERTAATLEDRPYVIVAGDSILTILRSDDGRVEAEANLEEPPVAPLILGDVNSDGRTDIIVYSKTGYYGYLVYQRTGTSVLSFLMLCAMGMLGLLFITQYRNQI